MEITEVGSQNLPRQQSKALPAFVLTTVLLS
jgi:hypothetical protein